MEAEKAQGHHAIRFQPVGEVEADPQSTTTSSGNLTKRNPTSSMTLPPGVATSGSGAGAEKERTSTHRSSDASRRVRRLSFEYILPVLTLVAILGYGFILVSRACAATAPAISGKLRKPHWLMEYLGSVGYDHTVDYQVGSFIFHFATFIFMYGAMGLVMWWLRRLSGPTSLFLPASAGEEVFGGSGGVGPAGTGKHAARTSLRGPRWLTRCFTTPSLRVFFIFAVGLGFLIFAHGPHFFFLLLLPTINFVCFKGLQRIRGVPFWFYMVFMWTIHVSLLYLNEVHSGYEGVYWLQKALPSSVRTHLQVVGQVRRPLWRTRMRWFLAYRMFVLRMIAFNYDMWEANRSAAVARERALSKHLNSCVECAKLRERYCGKARPLTNSDTASGERIDAAKELLSAHADGCQEGLAGPSHTSEAARDESLWCYKLRTEYPRPTDEYTYLNYIAYLLYTPVYLTGPITSFNAFVSHMHVPTRAMPPRDMVRYGLRILIIFLMMHFLLSFVYVNALSEHGALVLKFSLPKQAYFMYYYLAYLWLKFCFMWRCSRLFSLWCGVDVPENMRRCFTNTFSVRDFWRDWHASFNLWIVRYMYIPMGGRKRILFSIAPIFFFIAIWHDHALHLLKWAGCIVVMFALELLVSSTFGRLTAAFRKEMASVGEGTMGQGSHGAPTETTDGTGNEKDESAKSRLVSQMGCVRRGFRAAARFAVLYMSPRQRHLAYRAIIVLGGSTTVFALIVANLVGYHVLYTSGKNTSDTDTTIETGLASASVNFHVGLVLAMILAAWQGVLSREMAAQEEAELRVKYGLTTVASATSRAPTASKDSLKDEATETTVSVV